MAIKAKSKFVTLTRIYKVTKTGEMKTQSFVVNTEAVTSLRASNRLGYPQHRSTIRLADGTEVDLSDTFSTVKTAIGA